MRVNILGAGSVGLGIAASLVIAGAKVTVLARGKTLQALRSDGIRITGVLGEHTVLPSAFSVSDAARSDPSVLACYVVIVTTKTYETAPALETLLSGREANAALPSFLLLQNGWGSAEEVKNIMPKKTPLFSGIIMTGLERLEPTHVQIHAHADGVQTGSLFDDNAETILPLIALSKHGFLPYSYESAIEPVLLAKLIYNICLNPLSALLHCSYGELLGNEATLCRMELIADEGIRVLTAARGFSSFTSGKEYVRGVLVPKWSAKVAAHHSSMLQDIEAGRPTEIAYLNGAITALGRKFGIETPHNDIIVKLIRDAESVEKKRA